jgi:ferredoxin
MTLPELDAARCVHAAMETAQCQACVEACPRDAWLLDEEALHFEAGRCDGCGLCKPACPPQAIRISSTPARRKVAGTSVLLAACDQAVSHAGPGQVGCLHGIGLADLLREYRAGLRVWLFARGDCASCPRGGGETLHALLARLNEALGQRNQPLILTRDLRPDIWTALLPEQVTKPSARRGFFRALVSRTATGPLPEPHPPEAPGRLLTQQSNASLPWSVHIDHARCVACHACARICPEQAIRFDHHLPAYLLDAPACTGCGLCRDVCEPQAVKIQAWTAPPKPILPLTILRCRICGVECHAPAEAAIEATCWVCRTSSARKRLL